MLQSLSLISTFVFTSESIILESCEVIACTDVYFEQVFNSSGVATHGPTPWWTALVPAETFPSILSGGWSNYASTEPGYESRVRNNLYQKMNRFRGWTNMVQKTVQKATKIWKKKHVKTCLWQEWHYITLLQPPPIASELAVHCHARLCCRLWTHEPRPW